MSAYLLRRAGWEIDIDASTAARYQQLTGQVGGMIRQNIVEVDGVWQFRLGEDDRCPFLRGDGLCELIRRAGESILCEICRNPPITPWKPSPRISNADYWL